MLMNKYLLPMMLLLSAVLFFLLYDGNPDNSINVTHPEYDDSTVDYVQVTTYHSSENKSGYTYEELVAGDGYDNGKDIELEVLFQELDDGNVCQNCYGYSMVTANAVFSQRGQSSRIMDKKSFKVALNPDGEPYKGEYILNLKKHTSDITKVKNKLIFDLIGDIPNTLVPNTKFVHLTVRDLTGTGEYIDLGLFTHHEQVDEYFLQRRGLNTNGNMYNINFFEFYRYEDSIMLESDPMYKKSDFEDYLESKLDDDHTKLIDLLDAIESPLVPINAVVSNYFNRDNYLTYLAVNMIVDNIDAAGRNFRLYSPADEDAWYFIFWDLDKTFNNENVLANQWRTGIHLYMNDNLHGQFLEIEENRDDLTEKMEELRPYFTDEIINAYLEEYRLIAEDLIIQEISTDTFPVTYDYVVSELSQITDWVDRNYDDYYESLKTPKPVFIGNFERKTNYHTLAWNESFDFNDEALSYTVKISTNPEMTDIVHEETTTDTEIAIENFEPGNYFVTVTTENESGYTQEAYDQYIDGLNYYFGVKNLVAE